MSLLSLPVLLLTLIVSYFSYPKNNLPVLPQNSNPVLNPSPLLLLSPSPNQKQKEDSFYFYPNSNLISQNKNSFVLESNDNPSQITSWYQEKIKTKGFKAISISQTNTNNNVYNKLTAASKGSKIEITISKKANQEKTQIEVSSF